MSSFFQSYGGNLPSSFNMILSQPEFFQQVHQCRFKYGYFLLFCCIYSKLVDFRMIKRNLSKFFYDKKIKSTKREIQFFPGLIEVFFLKKNKISNNLSNLKLVVTKLRINESSSLNPSKTSCRSFLRGRFTLHRNTVCRKPRTFGYHDFHMIYRYSCQHSHF